MIVPAAAQTPTPGDPHWVLVNAVDASIRPGFLQMQEEAFSLETNVEALCGEPSEATLETARNQFRSMVVAYSRIEFLRFGPLVETTAPSGCVLAGPQGHRAAAGAADPRRARRNRHRADEPSGQERRGAGSRGAGVRAVRHRRETLATIEADFRCRYALGDRDALVAVSDELAEPGTQARASRGASARRSRSMPTSAPRRKSLEELVSAMAFGLEAIRDQRLLPFLGRDGEAPKPNSAPFWRSGMTVPAIVAKFDGLFDLFEKSRIVEAVPAGEPLDRRQRRVRERQLRRAAAAVTAPVEEALADPAAEAGARLHRHPHELAAEAARREPVGGARALDGRLLVAGRRLTMWQRRAFLRAAGAGFAACAAAARGAALERTELVFATSIQQADGTLWRGAPHRDRHADLDCAAARSRARRDVFAGRGQGGGLCPPAGHLCGGVRSRRPRGAGDDHHRSRAGISSATACSRRTASCSTRPRTISTPAAGVIGIYDVAGGLRADRRVRDLRGWPARGSADARRPDACDRQWRHRDPSGLWPRRAQPRYDGPLARLRRCTDRRPHRAAAARCRAAPALDPAHGGRCAQPRLVRLPVPRRM